MLTLEEVLADVADSPSFRGLEIINVSSRGNHGETPLHWMATLGDVVGMRLLIEAGADINAVDEEGNSSLHEAVTYRQTLAARFLIESGSSLMQKNKSGMTPEELAQSDHYAPMIKLFISAIKLRS